MKQQLLKGDFCMRPTSIFAAAACIAAPVMAESAERETAFTLGQIIVTGERSELGIGVGNETLNSSALIAFSRPSLDDAVNLMPGVVASNSGGSRNERLIFVRGFDRFQIPISIDGIRVYLPADNRLDFGRFLTGDIAEIQIVKGHASVLDGPGAMGGAINLVTSKPTRLLEGELRGMLDLDRDGGYGGYNVYARLGTAQEKWYGQASFARSFRDHWDLPGGYRPTAGSAQGKGARDFSRTADWRLNVKAGLTPNDTDEYALSYTRQEGDRNAPLHVTDPPATQRFWSWPNWNIDSIYFLSTTALGDRATLKTRIYRNSFYNLLRAFDDRSQSTQTLGRAFNSYYSDKAWGGSAELGLYLSDANKLTVAMHYRRDKHVEWQQGFPSGITEPPQTNLEDTYNMAAENRLTINPALVLTLGVSHDWRELLKAEEYGTPPGGGAATIFSYPLRGASATNGQARLAWSPNEQTMLNISVSSRTRFPTVFERFSMQFGTAASNPDLKPERAINYELGLSHEAGNIQLEGTVFYSDISDAIVSVRPAGFPANTNQRQNLGKAKYVGYELSVTAPITPSLMIGANYGYIHRKFKITGAAPDTTVPVFELTDVPAHKGFLYVEWKPADRLRILPSVELVSDRTTSTTASPPVYYQTGSHVLGNLRVEFMAASGIEVSAGVRNLFDAQYSLTDGFPEAGRSFQLGARARF